MCNEIYRFQNITNYDTNVGAMLLRNVRDSVTGKVYSPIHVYDISAFNNEDFTVCGRQLGWASTAANAAVLNEPLLGQTAAGGAASVDYWLPEKNTASTPYPAAPKALHNWTDIRLNFYGPRKRTTWFEVMFFTVKNEFADFMYAGNTNAGMQCLLQYLERPLIYNNLQTDVNGNANRMIKVLKRYRYYVSAAQTTDTDTSVGKVKEAKIFMKHDRLRNYDWQHTDLSSPATILPHGDTDGDQYFRDDDVHNHPEYGKTLFMLVRAFAPERGVVTGYSESVSADRDPTYDVIIRNSFSYVRSQNSV